MSHTKTTTMVIDGHALQMLSRLAARTYGLHQPKWLQIILHWLCFIFVLLVFSWSCRCSVYCTRTSFAYISFTLPHTHFHLQLSNTLWLLDCDAPWWTLCGKQYKIYNDVVVENKKHQQQQLWRRRPSWGWALLRFLSTLMSALLSNSLSLPRCSVRLYSQPIWNASHRKSLNEWWRCENYLSVQFNQSSFEVQHWNCGNERLREREREKSNSSSSWAIYIYFYCIGEFTSLIMFILYLPVKHSIDHSKHIGYFSVS